METNGHLLAFENISIPYPRIEKMKVNFGSETLLFNVFSDLQANPTWLEHSPKLFLFRFKSKVISTKKNKITKKHYSVDVPARYAHPEHIAAVSYDKLLGKKTSEFAIDTTNTVQKQYPINNIKLNRNGAVTIPIDCNQYFESVPVKNDLNVVVGIRKLPIQNRRGSYREGTRIHRIAEYFKFAYVINKEGKLHIGDLSPQTIKIIYENNIAVSKLI